MKNLYSQIFLLILLVTSIFYSAQKRILPLDTTPKDSIKAGDYLKDIDNDYKPFVGDWKAGFDNMTILLRIRKVSKMLSEEGFREDKREYFEDVLIMQHVILDSAGNVIEDYFSPNLKVYKILSQRYSKVRKTAFFYYSGANCGSGAGGVDLSMVDSTHFTWSYTGICGVWGGCPKNTDLTVHIPTKRGLIFTKM
ncbi:DUF6705 family protein [Chryseobacterium sp. 22532]|uniref:DUF6705 family protein n=1 Tax=Chryseobacterium sp. 22532 TaxID=3453938 RepID=UPI003F83B944